MPEIRQNLITREWVIIATERAKRPEEFSQKGKKIILPEFDPTCPFCPGNEHKTPAATFSLEEGGRWKVRATPNKFPALSSVEEKTREISGIKRKMSGAGVHEVVIETPLHNTTTALLSEKDVQNIIITYQKRYEEIAKDKRCEMIIIFKNHGESAGTSLLHPHSQIIATPMVPLSIRERIETAINYFDDTGECIFCKVLGDELQDDKRIIIDSKHFTSFIPYAAFSPFHIWIFPKRHTSVFSDIRAEEISDLSIVLRNTLRKLYFALQDPDFNYVIRSSPIDIKEADYFHWYLTIVPRVSKAAGFELGSGMFINTARPEESAKFLRETKV